jgi:hypothetical protein
MLTVSTLSLLEATMFQHSRMSLAGCCLWPVLWASPMAGYAAGIEVPLLVESRFVARAVGEALELDAGGRGRISADECNRVELDDLVVSIRQDELMVSVAVRAVSGAWAFGDCRGPAPWLGRVNLELVPGLEPGGLAVNFAPSGAELVRPDGSPSLFSGATRQLAESLILPRMARVRLDLAGSLATIDALLASALAGGPSTLLEPARLHEIQLLDTGLSLHLGFRIDTAQDLHVLPAEPPLAPEEQVRWERLEDELDGFLTTVIAALAAQAASDEVRLELLAVLLDARHAIGEALRENGGEAEEGANDAVPDPAWDPVRRIFIESWNQMRPWIAQLDLAEQGELDGDLRLAAFIAGGDALQALDRLGPAFGLEIGRDGLRRMARMLLAEDAPERFTPLPLDVDPALRSLFGLDRPRPPETRGLLLVLLDLLAPAASAEDVAPADALRGLVPRLAFLDEYLALVDRLLAQQTGEYLQGGSRVPARLEARFDPLVRATAWKESCWRQFTGSTANPRVLTSPVGALGMMQINARVWRGTYELPRLAEEVDYNVTAGTEILEHYLVDYAIRRGEHEHPGGDDNLIRATYAAYNGGPSHLGRYRRENTPARLRAIDNEFWRHYQTIKSEQWPEVSSCYAVGDSVVRP